MLPFILVADYALHLLINNVCSLFLPKYIDDTTASIFCDIIFVIIIFAIGYIVNRLRRRISLIRYSGYIYMVIALICLLPLTIAFHNIDAPGVTELAVLKEKVPYITGTAVMIIIILALRYQYSQRMKEKYKDSAGQYKNQMEQMLSGRSFVRIHRTCIVNLNANFDSSDITSAGIRVMNEILPVSRGKEKIIKNQLNEFQDSLLMNRARHTV